jgi:hypothetical protein
MKNTYLKFNTKDRYYISLPILKKTCYGFFYFAIWLILLFPKNISAQDCSFSLTAKNNIESVNDEGRIYFITLQNNSNEEIDVKLSVGNHNSDRNPDQTGSRENVNLTAKLLKTEGQEFNGMVKLLPKKPFEFQVKVTVPTGTPINHWNHMQLIAASDKCDGYKSQLTLYTFIPNTEEK